MFDPPHLLKNIRNNLKKQNFMMYGKEISWSYIEQFYLFDKENEVRYAPKLTDDHINLPFNKKMKVNLAAQVLSHTVAAGICTLIRTGYFEEKVQQTAIFIKEIDSIFNSMNSSLRYSPKPNGNALTSENVNYLNHGINLFTNLIPKNGRKLPCIKGWIITLKSTLNLYNEI